MFSTVKQKIRDIIGAGYTSKYNNEQIIWERLRTGEPILFKKLGQGNGIFAKPYSAGKGCVGVVFEEVDSTFDFCRFHEEPV